MGAELRRVLETAFPRQDARIEAVELNEAMRAASRPEPSR
jgi:hypothetical protein